MKKLVTFAALLLALAGQLAAADIYFHDGAAGSNNGTNCANAFDIADGTHGINAAGNWVGDNNLRLCGTITRTTNATLIIANGSGSAGHPVTVKFEPGAILQADYWDTDHSAIDIDGVHHITVDFGSDGLIQNTNNGEGFTYAAASAGLRINNTHDVEIKGTPGGTGGVRNICIHLTVTTETTCAEENGANIAIGNGISGNVWVHHLNIHDANKCMFYGPADGDGSIEFSNLTLSRCKWELQISSGSGTSVGPVLFHDNDVTCVAGATCNWQDNDDNFHLNGVFVFPQGTLTFNALYLYDNYFHDITGNATASIYLDPGAGSDVTNARAFNNIFSTTFGAGPGNAQFVCPVFSTGCLAVNNTFVGPTAAQGSITNDLAGRNQNNISSGTASGLFIYNGYGSFTSDRNVYYNLTGGDCIMSYNNLGGICFPSVAAWTSTTGLDGNSVITDPKLNSDFTLQAGSPAIGLGANLTSLGITELNTGAPQFFGNVATRCGTGCIARPSSGAWDAGAYPSGTTPPPALTGNKGRFHR